MFRKNSLIFLLLFTPLVLCAQGKFTVNRDKIDEMLRQKQTTTTTTMTTNSSGSSTTTSKSSTSSNRSLSSTTSKSTTSSTSSQSQSSSTQSSEENKILSVTDSPFVANQNQGVGGNSHIDGVVVFSNFVFVKLNYKVPAHMVGAWVALSSKTVMKVANNSTKYKIIEWGYFDKDNELVQMKFDEHYNVNSGSEYSYYMIFEAPNFAFNKISIYEDEYSAWYWEGIKLNEYGSYVEEETNNQPVVRKFNAIGLSYKEIDPNGKSSEWSKWEDVNILIVYNGKENTLEIYSKETQEFDIVRYDPDESDSDGGVISPMFCVDKEGRRCKIRYRQTKNNTLQLYIDYDNFMYVYNMVEK